MLEDLNPILWPDSSFFPHDFRVPVLPAVCKQLREEAQTYVQADTFKTINIYASMNPPRKTGAYISAHTLLHFVSTAIPRRRCAGRDMITTLNLINSSETNLTMPRDLKDLEELTNSSRRPKLQ